MKDKKLHQTISGILKDFQRGLKRNIERKRKELREILKTEYDHDCHAGPEDGCQTCNWIDNASLGELLGKVKEFELEREEARTDHLVGDEYEPPTPSDGQDYQENFQEPTNPPDKREIPF